MVTTTAKTLVRQDSVLVFERQSEVSELYMTILEDTFKSNEGDRKKQIQGLKERIKDQEDKIARCDDMLLNREIDRHSHSLMISKLKEEIAILRED